MKWWRRRFEHQLDAELQFHLEEQIRDFMKSGMTEEEARRTAMNSFGNASLIKEDVREAWGWTWIERLVQDLRYASRLLRQAPAFTIVAVLTLGIGIGATSAIFTQVNAVFWNPLPVQNPEELRTLAWTSPTLRFPNSFTYATHVTMREKMHLSDLACAWKGRDSMAEWGPISFQLVTGNYFRVLGVNAALGRMITPEDDQTGSPSFIAVISYRLWQRAYGGDSDVLNRSVTINGRSFQIVGVMAEGFAGLFQLEPREVMLPYAAGPFLGAAVPPRDPNTWSCNDLVGRIGPETREDQVRAEGQAILEEALIINPSKDGKDARLVMTAVQQSRGTLNLRERTLQPLMLMIATAGVILLITCANIAGLLLARGRARHKELATRLAVGASRPRVVRQLVTESVLLSLLGGVLGIVLAYATAPAFPDLLGELSGRDWLKPALTPGVNLRPDLRVLGVAVALAIFTGIIFGLLPAIRATRVDLVSMMKQAAGSGGGRLRLKTGKLLVCAQVGLSMLLLIGAGLFIRTLINLRSVPIGYDRNGLVFVMLDPARNPQSFIQDTVRTLENLPGVTSAAVSQWPIYNNAQPRLPVCVPGHDRSEHGMDVEPVSPRFFETWGVRLVLGRDFDLAQDTGKGVIVNDKFAKTFFPNRNPLGQQIGIGKCPGTVRAIVGVVGDHLDRQRMEITPMVYVPYPFSRRSSPSTFAVRTSGDPRTLVPALRRLMADAGANVDGDVMVGSTYVEREWRKERLLAGFLVFFGILALAISCLGIYGMLAYTVTWRTSEIGIRMALGAQRPAVVRMVIRESLLPVAAGILLGLAGALALTRWVESILFGVSKHDPLTIGAAALLFLLTAGIAAFVPARRASRIDPTHALRYE
jgi:predicted permease